MKIDNYEVEVSRLSKEDGGGYLATVADLPGCMSDGETKDEAVSNLRDAMAAWMATARQMGRTVPEPTRYYA